VVYVPDPSASATEHKHWPRSSHVTVEMADNGVLISESEIPIAQIWSISLDCLSR
jgi:hypothetical protein